VVVSDGVEAILEIQRRLPRAVLLGADLPKMFGFQVCEVVKRNDSLRETFVVLAGAIHHQDRYRRPPGELYGADAYLEGPDLPDALLPLLARAGLPVGASSEPAAPAPSPAPTAPLPPRQAKPAPSGDGLDEERAKAERLARIIVSDIVLYNEEKFTKAIREGTIATAMEGDLAEGRGLFRERIDPRIRDERDHLLDELVRVARSRGMK
jgi:CheY-like chemotaxis protein